MPVVVAQVDEQQLAVVALAVYPAADRRTSLPTSPRPQLAAAMRTVEDACWFPSLTNGPAARPARAGAAKGTTAPRGVKRGRWPGDSVPAMTLITDTDALAAFCTRLRAEFVAVDTEFMRERTYWPKLCLVQVAGADEAVAIDPLAPGIDLPPLLDLMADARCSRCSTPPARTSRSSSTWAELPRAAVRHPGGGHGVRLRRGGRLRNAGGQARQAPRSTRRSRFTDWAAGR